MLSVGLLGHGVVGSGVAEILIDNADVVALSAGQGVRLAKIADITDFSKLSYGRLFTKDAQEIVNDSAIDVVAECIGGTRFALPLARRTLENGKHFVTSNKELVAEHGEELLTIAREKGVQFLYEASTGGGIPAISPIQHCLGANRLSRVSGILNGTTNFILTRMRDGGVSFEAALQEAQSLGYAEADPSADVQGLDARRKINILAHVAFGAVLGGGEIPTEGITALAREDILYARELGRSIKLLGVAERVEGGVTARVSPVMLPLTHPLSHISDVFNGVLVKGDKVDEVMFFGRGAGKEPTASAVVADLIAIAKGMPMTDRVPSSVPLVAGGQARARFFLRIVGTQADADVVAREMPSARVVWPENVVLQGSFGVITAEGAEDALRKELGRLPGVHGAAIRFEGA